MSDPRFARLRSDPRFKRPKKTQAKVVVDNRFKALLDDESKKKPQRLDKYGRKTRQPHQTDNLNRFYRAEDEERRLPDLARGETLLESSDEEEEEEAVEDETDDEETVTWGQKPSKPIRVPNDKDDLEIDLDESEDAYAILDAQAAHYSKDNPDPGAEDAPKTRRLAIVNLDWDHVNAVHLYKIFSSVVSLAGPGARDSNSLKRTVNIGRGRLLNVKVYPSQFGKERMKKEELEGPPKQIFKAGNGSDDDEDVQEAGENEYNEDELRKYQLERLRYYYAVAEFDTVAAATHAFNELDGTELERSANVLDVSFVPDDMTFDDPPTSEATDSTQVSDSLFKGLDFTTAVLRQSKVKLTWDDDDPDRGKVTKRALTLDEIEKGDFKNLIASDSDSGSEDETGKKASKRNKLRSLLLSGDNDELPEGWGGIEDDKSDNGMQVSFMPALSGNTDSKEESTLDKYKRKMKEKRLERLQGQTNRPTKNAEPEGGDDFFEGIADEEEREEAPRKEKAKEKGKKKAEENQLRVESTEAELALLVAPDDPDAEPDHFSMKSVLKAEKSKGKKRARQQEDVQESFQINVKDDRFAALHEDHSFAIDPSNPLFKKTKSMSALLDERHKRLHDKRRPMGEAQPKNVSVEDRSLDNLVESVKRKSSLAKVRSSKRPKVQ